VPDVQDLDWDDLVMLVGMSTDEATALMEQADVWVEEETRYVRHRKAQLQRAKGGQARLGHLGAASGPRAAFERADPSLQG
jgi:hypothetical protein